MPQVLNINDIRNNIIDAGKLSSGTRLREDLIAPASESVQYDIAPEHAAEPIKSMEDIFRISQFLTSNGRYRDNMLFIVGINFGLRASDLRMLRFSNLINDNLVFRERFPVFEQKTRNTRKKKKNRYITINRAVIEAVTLYLEHTPGVSLSDYMFCSASNNRGCHEIHSDGKDQARNERAPLSVRSIDRILKGIANDLGFSAKMSTHTLRKTFCYHQMVMSHNDSRKLLLLQQMLNHSSPMQTLAYIGITSEEIDDAYKRLNLGSVNHNYLIDSDIIDLRTNEEVSKNA